ncbi:uncharacterized protein LOC126653824 [Mercurialis annua]|uniref:uncharacterized protein LOC126653824 n=1 Tax=Mercurialis annua TaxID=3986 RepID=UPI00216088A3|nr:uncharacterized protein LOC126653824 [Mercurialis annua]
MVSNSTSLLTISTHNSISSPLLFPNEPLLKHSSLPSLRFKNDTGFNSHHLLPKRCNLFSLPALKKSPTKNSTATLVEMSDLDDDFDDELDAFDDDFVDDGDGDDEEEGAFLPLGKMQKWLENKPSGFGVGKVYDTPIEDKLLEEIEQSRKAQAVNLDNLKNKAVPKNQNQSNKVVEVVDSSGVLVRVLNLPKKKNVHRDLQLAFKDVYGVVKIVPAVTGNKKTKDPVCKGFAFVDFKSEEDANRFVQQFSGQSILFGKIQKQIKCVTEKSHSSKSSDDKSAGSFSSGSKLTVLASEEDTNANFNIDNSSVEETSSDVPDTDEISTTKFEDVTDSVESLSISEVDNDDSMQPESGSLSQTKQNKRQATEKKTTVKDKKEKVPKKKIPGSAKRLMMKEKAVLTDVFSKYGSQSVPASVEKS